MGFGSYDESEQREQTSTDEDVDAVNLHENAHDGEVTVESDLSTDELVAQLDSMREKEEE